MARRRRLERRLPVDRRLRRAVAEERGLDAPLEPQRRAQEAEAASKAKAEEHHAAVIDRCGGGPN
jgi:hypothetical protein